MSGTDRIREYFEKNVGKILRTEEIAKIARVGQYARRIRELRDEEGMQILTNRDRADLKPGEYVLVSMKRKPRVARTISNALRNEILERNGHICQYCGRGAGDPDPVNPKRTLILHIDHVTPVSQGGTSEKDNLRVLCSACNHSRSNIEPAGETAKNILARIRKLKRSEKEEIFERLKDQI